MQLGKVHYTISKSAYFWALSAAQMHTLPSVLPFIFYSLLWLPESHLILQRRSASSPLRLLDKLFSFAAAFSVASALLCV